MLMEVYKILVVYKQSFQEIYCINMADYGW